MSKICVLLVKTTEDEKALCNELTQFVREAGLSLFFYENIDEPFDILYNTEYLRISVSDNEEYDNCEMLFLPDNCYINGMKNSIPYTERIITLSVFLKFISERVEKFELFVGESGAAYDDYKKVVCGADEFASHMVSNALLGFDKEEYLHFVFYD